MTAPADSHTRAGDRLRRVRSTMARVATAIVASLGLALLAAACGASGRSQVAQLGSTTTQSRPASDTSAASARGDWLDFSHCMRSNGVARYPDPDSSGRPPKETPQQLGVSSTEFQTAQNACRRLLPNGGQPPSQAERQQVRAQALSFSQCVRDHGVPNFPDPGSDGRIPDPATVGVDQGSPKFQAANQACRRFRPPYIPSNAAYNVWARTHTTGQ